MAKEKANEKSTGTTGYEKNPSFGATPAVETETYAIEDGRYFRIKTITTTSWVELKEPPLTENQFLAKLPALALWDSKEKKTIKNDEWFDERVFAKGTRMFFFAENINEVLDAQLEKGVGATWFLSNTRFPHFPTEEERKIQQRTQSDAQFQEELKAAKRKWKEEKEKETSLIEAKLVWVISDSDVQESFPAQQEIFFCFQDINKPGNVYHAGGSVRLWPFDLVERLMALVPPGNCCKSVNCADFKEKALKT